MFEWFATTFAMVGIGEIVKAIMRRDVREELQNKLPVVVPVVLSKLPVRYQNKGKQMMYEQYLQDLRNNPEWAAFKVKHNQYGGYVFDDTEN